MDFQPLSPASSTISDFPFESNIIEKGGAEGEGKVLFRLEEDGGGGGGDENGGRFHLNRCESFDPTFEMGNSGDSVSEVK